MVASKIGLGGPCWAPKSVLESLLAGSWGHLGPKSQTRPPRVGRRASKDLPGTPKLEAKLDPKRTKLGPNGVQVGVGPKRDPRALGNDHKTKKLPKKVVKIHEHRNGKFE